MLTGGVSRFHPDPVAVLEVAAKHIRDHNRINHRDSNLGVDVGALVAVAKYLSRISKRPPRGGPKANIKGDDVDLDQRRAAAIHPRD
jgi:hypothetical protein